MCLELAAPDLSKRLQVDEGEPVVSRGFIRYADDQPLSLETSYYPMDIAREAGLVVPTTTFPAAPSEPWQR